MVSLIKIINEWSFDRESLNQRMTLQVYRGFELLIK